MAEITFESIPIAVCFDKGMEELQRDQSAVGTHGRNPKTAGNLLSAKSVHLDHIILSEKPLVVSHGRVGTELTTPTP
jgi:hypothetical protein